MDDSVPEEEEVAGAVFRLRLNWVGGLSDMRADHIQAWLWEATQDESMDPSQWDMDVDLVQTDFCEGHLA